MTNPLIPYSFTPGTKAKAQEVNANFNALADKIDENDSTTVHENTESNITGQKTFTKPIYSTVKGIASTGNLIIQNLADGESSEGIIAFNENNTRIGSIRFLNGDNYNEVWLTAAQENGDIKYLSLKNENGITYATCPTYTQNYADSSTKIVTTAYMAEHWTTTKATTASTASKQRPAVVIQNYVNGNSWYRIWSDGWKEQGGYCAVQYNTQTKVTFLKAFSNANYSLTVSGRLNLQAGYTCGMTISSGSYFEYKSEQNFKWYACGY